MVYQLRPPRVSIDTLLLNILYSTNPVRITWWSTISLTLLWWKRLVLKVTDGKYDTHL